MLTQLERLNEYLAYAYQTVRIDWNPILRLFVMHDFLCTEHGVPYSAHCMRTPTALRGIIPSENTNRVTVMTLKELPSRDKMAEVLGAMFVGQSDMLLDESLEKTDSANEKIKETADKQSRELVRECAETAWNRGNRVLHIPGLSRENNPSGSKVDKEIATKIRIKEALEAAGIEP
jgi:hypothetical protein